MSLARLILLALLGGAELPDPAARIADLSSPSEAVRTEAAGIIEETGRPALPALYRARQSNDPALRGQVEQLIDLIERQRLLRATKVRLDFDDTPLPEAAEALRAQTDFRVVVAPDDALRARRVTLHATEPVPFWEALDRLGAASGARHNPGIAFWPAPSEPSILLVRAQGPPVPTSDAGPFRVHLVQLSRHRDVIPARPPAVAKRRENLTADLQVFAEPGLVVNPTGPVILEEVVDDRGQDLRPQPPIGPARTRWRPRFEEGQAALFPLPVPLRPSPDRGVRLRKFKGHVPISVVARTGDPLVVPLAGADGKTFSKGEVALRVTEIARIGEDTSFKIAIRDEEADRRSAPGVPMPLGLYQPDYRVEDHLQVQDDQGRALWWNAIPHRGPDGVAQGTLVTVYKGQKGPPARLLYHGLVGATTELAFEFADLPLP